QFIDDIDHTGIADVRAVLFESQSHHQDLGANNVQLALGHQLSDPASDIASHAVVDTPAGQNHLRVIAHLLRLVGQVVRIDPDTVPANQAGAEIKEIPLGTGCLQHFVGRNAHTVEQ